MQGKTLTDIAFDYLKRKKKEVPFNKLWKDVSMAANYDEDLAQKKMVLFYNAIMLDARFISLPDNKWDLKLRHTFDEARINSSVLTLDDLDDDSDLLDEFDEFENENEDDF